jgi:mannose-6-phosphate isomerase-like protein (cupin superfamily)
MPVSDAPTSSALVKSLDTAAEFFIDEGCFVIETTSSTEDPNLSIARCRVEPGKTTRWHHLLNTTERYVILSGEGIVNVGDLPARAVTAGDTVIIPPECRQRISNTGASDLLFLALCTPRFSPDIYVDIEPLS